MKQYFLTRPLFDKEELERVAACLDSRWVTQGPHVEQFERLFGARHRVPYALATTSCTAALHLAAMALGLGPGDGVMVPALTWITSANCAEYVGAKVNFVDVELDTFNMNPVALEAAITSETRALVVVHLFGLAARMDEIMTIARRHNLMVIEDAACAVGTTYDSQPVGSIGDVGCFSFHPRKVITTGEGGMATTRDATLRRRIEALRNHGITGVQPQELNKPFAIGDYDLLGYNLRMSDIQGAIGIAQMGKLDALLAERKRLADRYT